jgi:hypothetical protein
VDLVMDPTNSQVLYGAAAHPAGNANNSVYKTTDGGATWSVAGDFPVGGTQGRISLAISPTNNQVLFAGVANTSNNKLLAVYQTTNAGTNWTQLPGIPNFAGTQAFYDLVVAVDPTDATGNTFFASGQAGGNSFLRVVVTPGSPPSTAVTDISGGSNPPHADHHVMAFDSNNRLLDGDDGGIWRLDSTSPGVAWTNLNGNLGITEFVGVALDPVSAAIAYGGSQDNGSEKYTGVPAWTAIAGGDGGFVRVDQSNNMNVYHEYFSVNLNRSNDGGMTFTNIVSPLIATASATIGGGAVTALTVLTNGLGYSAAPSVTIAAPASGTQATATAVVNGGLVTGLTIVNPGSGYTSTPTVTIGPPPNGRFYVPYVLDPSNSKRLLYGVASLYETTDATLNPPTWTVIGAPGSNGFNAGGAGIVAIAISKSNPNTIYVSTGSQIFRTTNDGGTWTDVTILGFGSSIADLQVDPFNSQVVYAVRSRVGLGKVFRSTDGGANWSNITGDLPDAVARSLVIDPRSTPETLYLGNDTGVYVSYYQGGAWVRFSSGLPNVQVKSLDLQLNGGVNRLGAGTYGRGLFEIQLNTPLAVNAVVPTGLVEGQRFSDVETANFTDPAFPAGSDPMVYYQATISWGDGTSSAGTVSLDADGVFHVTALTSTPRRAHFISRRRCSARAAPAAGRRPPRPCSTPR